VICNTVAAEVSSRSPQFAAAMAEQKSLTLSLAGTIEADRGVSVFGFAPGVVDTPLVRNLAARTPRFLGMTQEEYIENVIRNPG
jgi:NAD(P)-dependent dehydrogenase (short-subunit alcohol dehydrogenase family)